jgi:hypothetical protein
MKNKQKEWHPATKPLELATINRSCSRQQEQQPSAEAATINRGSSRRQEQQL